MMTEDEKRALLEGSGFPREGFQKKSRNYLVEAGAGAGKTTLMVRRIVNQLVTGYCEPKELVAITFTNKSTLELRKKLDDELCQRRDMAKAGGDETLRKRLEALIRESGQMQVSTIHSFCQTMLEAMPFASPLGLDMQVEEDDTPEAKAYLRRRLQEKNTTLFRDAQEMGVSPAQLEKWFLELRGNGEAELQYCQDPAKLGQWDSSVRRLAVDLQKTLHDIGVEEPVLEPALQRTVDMNPVAFAADPAAICRLAWQALYMPEKWWNTKNKKSKTFRDSEAGAAVDEVWNGTVAQGLREAAGPLLHSRLMKDMDELLRDYRAEQTKRHTATYDGLLLRCRDMLRDDREARSYFHQRYKVLYVDEMQDTDPVQTELLFYLTTDEQSFDETDWRNCRPVPGSLFLVGDPKQAIYRFRGADIGVYNTLEKLFQSEEDLAANGPATGTVGEKVTLRYNFRSAKEICDLADRVFDPNASASGTVGFTGGTYQARYVAMDAQHGACSLARTVSYPTIQMYGDSMDPYQVSSFIRTMIDTGAPVGSDPGKEPHAARPGDFLVLTSNRRSVEEYVSALKQVGVDVEASGQQAFSDIPPIARSVLHLQSMLAPRDDRLLIRVLRGCYPGPATEDEMLRKLMVRTGKGSLTGLLYPKQMADIRLALEAETPRDEGLLKLCAILEEIARLRRMVGILPAMAVLEHLMEGGYGLWKGMAETDLSRRRQIYAAVQQYLNLVRGSGERSFPALATCAIACAEKTYERELELEPRKNAVRVMNLHKAKGLEGEVVILANGWRKTDIPPQRHISRGGTVKEYAALHPQTWDGGKGPRDADFAVAWPEKWEQQRKEERRYLEAEYARLLYVAATRAKTMLVVCSGPEYFAGDGAGYLPYWKPLTDRMKMADEDDAMFGAAFGALLNGQLTQASAALGQKPPMPPQAVSVEPDVMEEQLEADSTKLAENRVYAITPSRLEHQARSVVNRPDEAEPEEAEETAASAPAPEDEEKDEELTAPAENGETASPAEASGGPYGPDWGTIVHRVMELAVRSGETDSEKLLTFARQAVFETLPEGTVTEKQLKMLGLTEDGKNPMEHLAQQAAGAASFLSDENSGLRRKMQGARCFPELPFFLRAEKNDEKTGELYRHLSDHITSDAARDRVLDVQGVIDLAILAEDGWYVVDYKTDKRLDDEDEETFRQRLRGEYTPQITAYARVLERLGQGPVKGAYLCSVPLGGELIELDIAPETL